MSKPLAANFLIVIGLLQFTTAVAPATERYEAIPQKLRLLPGEAKTIVAPGGHTELYISRRGVLDVTQIGPDQWHLIALKKGMVTLQFDSLGGGPDTPQPVKYFVEVGSITEKRAKRVTARLASQKTTSRPQSLRLMAWLVADHRSEQADFGTRVLPVKFWQTKSLSPKQLNDQLLKTESHVLASPTLHMTEGHQAHVRSGGEFRSTATAAHGTLPIWKEYGTAFTFQAQRGRDSMWFLDYEVSLQDIGGSREERRLTGGNYRGTVTLVNGRTELVGILDVASEQRRENGSFFLQSVPIIGPLFQAKSHANRRVKLWLFLHLEQFQSSNL